MKTRRCSPPLTDRARLIKRLMLDPRTVPPGGLNVRLALPLEEFNGFMNDVEGSLLRAALSPDIEDARLAGFLGGFHLGYTLAKHDLNPPIEEAEDVIDG